MTDETFDDDLRRVTIAQRERSAAIVRHYLDNRVALRSSLLVEYRCAAKGRGCLLLAAWQSAQFDGWAYVVPQYSLSPALNTESSNQSARSKNSDGSGRWNARGGVLDDLRGWGEQVGLGLNCDHRRQVFMSSVDLLADADSGTPGNPTRRFL